MGPNYSTAARKVAGIKQLIAYFIVIRRLELFLCDPGYLVINNKRG